MPIRKQCSRCGKWIASGSKCDCMKQRHKEYDSRYRDKQAAAFYHSAAWIRTRDYVLSLDNGCDVYLYMTTGQIVAADTVHHITPLSDDRNRALDIDNLISLSADTHSMIERRYRQDKHAAMNELYEMLKKYRRHADGVP